MKRFVSVILLVILVALLPGGAAIAASSNGSGGEMPAYYDGQLFNINFKEMPSEGTLLTHNKSINTIYMCDACEASGFMFVSVLDAIQGDGFNPLWQEVQIGFAGTPTQLTSDTD